MIVRPEAEADLRQARAWYERQRGGLACRQLSRLVELDPIGDLGRLRFS